MHRPARMLLIVALLSFITLCFSTVNAADPTGRIDYAISDFPPGALSLCMVVGDRQIVGLR